jgi:hypothetical protein
MVMKGVIGDIIQVFGCLSSLGKRAVHWSMALLSASLGAMVCAFAAPAYSELWMYRYGFLLGVVFALFMLVALFFKALIDSAPAD